MTVSMTVHEEPFIPAPLEPEIRREPTFREYCEGVEKMKALHVEVMKGGQA